MPPSPSSRGEIIYSAYSAVEERADAHGSDATHTPDHRLVWVLMEMRGRLVLQHQQGIKAQQETLV